MEEIKAGLSLGRSFEDYIQMFNLTADDLPKRFVGCGDGFSNFNARMNELGYPMVSCDPIYHYSKRDIVRIASEQPQETIRHPSQRMEDHLFLYNLRGNATDEFLEDYEMGKREGRYLANSLPELPFNDGEFDMALCSYFLFTQSGLGLDFHLASIREMARVAREVRIYPLVDLNCLRPDFFDCLNKRLNTQNVEARIVPVEYGFYPNDHEMLVVHLGD